jgi:hypothetical protein
VRVADGVATVIERAATVNRRAMPRDARRTAAMACFIDTRTVFAAVAASLIDPRIALAALCVTRRITRSVSSSRALTSANEGTFSAAGRPALVLPLLDVAGAAATVRWVTVRPVVLLRPVVMCAPSDQWRAPIAPAKVILARVHANVRP